MFFAHLYFCPYMYGSTSSPKKQFPSVFSVENTGPAIPTEHIPRLLNRFHRVDASRHRSDEGTGLGLAIVKSIIDIHGGTIEADSTEERTRFRVILHNLN